MIGSTAVVIDSESYLPRHVREQFGMLVVPMTVVIDGVRYAEFVDVDSVTFYERLAAGAQVSTSQPSPGEFLDAYERAKALGAARIVSIHIGSAYSGTVNSARIAAQTSTIPVHIIDTGQASFIEGLCAWEACEALDSGASIAEAEAVALAASRAAGNVFIVRGLELMKRGGRLKPANGEPSSGVPVLALNATGASPVSMATDIEGAMDAMVGYLQEALDANPGKSFRVGISNGAANDLAAILEARVRSLPQVTELVPYEVGPAVGVHTGPGCTGIVFLPRPAAADR